MSNYKLKHAVTTALSLIALGFQSQSLAIGLSDIQVQSHLGEPLKAQVNVLSANELKSPSCLKLGSNSDLSHVNFNLGKITGGNATATLTTNKVINEPILNLSVVAGCESAFTRNYVILLDPPIGLDTSNTISPNVQVSSVNDAPVVEKIDNAAKNSTTVATTPTTKAAPKAQQKKRKARKVAPKARKTTKKPAKPSTPTMDNSAPATQETVNQAGQPRLSISSGFSAPYVSTTGLRLDKQLTFTPDPNAVVANEAIAIEDEVTVMNNRLAHLQAQITALQAQNAKLKTENQQQSDQLIQAKATHSNFSGVLPWFGAGLLLLLSGYAGYHWYRRRQTLLQEHHTNAIWVNTSKNTEDEEVKAPSTTNELETEKEIFPEVDFGINTPSDAASEEESSAVIGMESTFESTKRDEETILVEDEQQFSVLDHADVFLSHGRAPLAIQLLQNHLLEHPKQSVTIWLFLLDLLAKENLEELYKETALDCKLHYNVEIADFSTQEANNNESLEDFPRLAKGLEDVWNTPAAVVYLDDLIYNSRLEPRAGLPKNLIEELVLLKTMANDYAASAEVIRLDEKKLAIIEQKEALLESKKAEKLKKMEEETEKARLQAEKKALPDHETNFEFTLIEN